MVDISENTQGIKNPKTLPTIKTEKKNINEISVNEDFMNKTLLNVSNSLIDINDNLGSIKTFLFKKTSLLEKNITDNNLESFIFYLKDFKENLLTIQDILKNTSLNLKNEIQNNKDNDILLQILNTDKELLSNYNQNIIEEHQRRSIDEIQNSNIINEIENPEESPKVKEKINFKDSFQQIRENLKSFFGTLSKTLKYASIAWGGYSIYDGIQAYQEAVKNGANNFDAASIGIKTSVNTFLSPLHRLIDSMVGEEGISEKYTNKVIDKFIDSIKWLYNIGEKIGEYTFELIQWWEEFDFKKSVISLASAISDWINKKWNNLIQWWNSSDLKKSVISLASAISGWINKKWNNLIQWWNSSDLKKSTVSLASAISNWITDKTQYVEKLLQDMFNNTINWFKNTTLGKWLFQNEEKSNAFDNIINSKNTPDDIKNIAKKLQNENNDFTKLTKDEIIIWKNYHVNQDMYLKKPVENTRQFQTAKNIAKNNTLNQTIIVNNVQNNVPQTNINNQSTQLSLPMSTDDVSFYQNSYNKFSYGY